MLRREAENLNVGALGCGADDRPVDFGKCRRGSCGGCCFREIGSNPFIMFIRTCIAIASNVPSKLSTVLRSIPLYSATLPLRSSISLHPSIPYHMYYASMSYCIALHCTALHCNIPTAHIYSFIKRLKIYIDLVASVSPSAHTSFLLLPPFSFFSSPQYLP